MKTVGVHEAKTKLSQLLREVEGGEEILVTRGGRPVARFVPVVEVQIDGGARKVRGGGMFKGQMHMSDDFEDDEEYFAQLFGITPAPIEPS